MEFSQNRWNRRRFLKYVSASSVVAGFMIVPRHVLGGPGQTPPSEKLNIAGVGVGNRGWTVIRQMADHNVVALCDVDANYLSKAADLFRDAATYRDFRQMLDKEHKNIDAVTVCSTDHTHAPASMAAMRAGKHVYCEKPLTHSVYESRMMAEMARKTGLATQMGNEAHSGHNYRRVVELIRAGAIGQVKEVHCWCDKAWGNYDRPKNTPPVPKTMTWDLWLGPAPYRPYHPIYHPMSWRSWWDFGNGRLGDMGCHMIDLPFWALDLKHPLTVEAEGPPVKPESSPLWQIVRWEFPARDDQPPVTLTWYDGNKRPPLQKEHNMPDYYEGTLFVGTDGMLIADYGHHELFPKQKFADYKRPPRTIPESPGHAKEWLAACKTGSPTGTHFEYSGPLTETVLLGTIAYRIGEKLKWDAEKMSFPDNPEATALTRREYRTGWTL